MRDSFIFYSSFYEAIEDIDEKTQNEILVAICRFALKGEEPKLEGWSKRIFALIRPQLLASIKRKENGQKGAKYGQKGAKYGQKGGRPAKNENPNETQDKPKPKNNPVPFSKNNPVPFSKKTPNVNDNVNVKGDCKGENEFPLSSTHAQNAKKAKKKYGSAENVLLTDEQHASLQANYGDKLPAMVEHLSNYIAVHGEKYKDHNRVLRDWVENAVREKKIKQKELEVREQRLSKTQGSDSKPSYDLEEYEKYNVFDYIKNEVEEYEKHNPSSVESNGTG